MSKFVINIDLSGDPGTVECVIDEVISNISYMDLDDCVVCVRNCIEKVDD